MRNLMSDKYKVSVRVCVCFFSSNFHACPCIRNAWPVSLGKINTAFQSEPLWFRENSLHCISYIWCYGPVLGLRPFRIHKKLKGWQPCYQALHIPIWKVCGAAAKNKKLIQNRVGGATQFGIWDLYRTSNLTSGLWISLYIYSIYTAWILSAVDSYVSSIKCAEMCMLHFFCLDFAPHPFCEKSSHLIIHPLFETTPTAANSFSPEPF